MSDHDYSRSALQEACDDDVIEEMELAGAATDPSCKDQKVNREHTPIKNKTKKKMKLQETECKEDTANAILRAIGELNTKMDNQTEILRSIEKRIEANTVAIDVNKKAITELQATVNLLKKENTALRISCEDHARYKRRWNLRVTGLPEKDDENIRNSIIGILTRIIPVSVDRLQDTVDTVHRLGKKADAASANNRPRAVIVQFGLRTMRDEVWKKSKDANVCKEMHISFREDFSKEDRIARAKLWPLVQEARSRGKRAYLKEGFALIDNRRVDPD
ncbi:uncharacterized protein LOC118563811 [Fundulus heteroclitus]|uniref:uncharacterized protein LOC118563811 n=1 Tax=Fundulus heteroclitus TaxID=8078 RepID=UPI00165C7CF8|nr:uncharacterized protein LOC118563811 [Fundulus heteroclitus]